MKKERPLYRGPNSRIKIGEMHVGFSIFEGMKSRTPPRGIAEERGQLRFSQSLDGVYSFPFHNGI